ncbi:MAG: TonB-dependent receptor [Ignavibacteriales bacterium]|nr:TonB-dependent receptor [Ignavibacteriales bacterium]
MKQINLLQFGRLCLLGVLLTSSTLLAQRYGKITGKVFDAVTSEPLQMATVVIEKTRMGAITDASGKYSIMKVPSGVYSVSVKYLGYHTMKITNVEVLTDLTSKFDFPLEPVSVKISGDIVVTASRDMVRKDITSTESRISADDIDKLPAQEVSQLIDQQAGVSRDAGGGLHIRGGRSTEISYLVNGISITDDYSRGQAVRIETNAIQELQVISGSFNAEYGNALSGVINYVTKTGSDRIEGNIELSTGDYITNRTGVFWGLEDVSPVANYNIVASAGGPVFPEKLSFYATGRRFYNDGWLYGINTYKPEGRYLISGTDTVANPGNGDWVSMSYEDLWSGQATLEYKPFNSLSLKTDFFGSFSESRSYNHIYRLNPDGDKNSTYKSMSVFPKLTHTISNTTFHELVFSYRLNENDSKLYGSPYDSRYVHPDSQNVSGYTFLRAGTNLNRFNRKTESIISKYEITSQLTEIHLVKAGLEVQADQITYENINLVPAEDEKGRQLTPFQPMVRGTDNTQHDLFERKPVKFAAYIQDKIEYESLIINLGMRFDLFDAKGKVPVDQEDPNVYNPLKLNHLYYDVNGDGDIGSNEQTAANIIPLAEREKFWWRKSKVKSFFSPRVGLAYPITDKGTIRFSYGIFQQIPEYSQLYLGDQLKITASQGNQGPFGNPDLKPQTTTIYEIGFKQMVTEQIAIDVTGYYRDIRNWISTSQPIPTFLAGTSYSISINKDFANVRGVSLSVRKLFADYYSFDIDYNFQLAEGTNSSPDQEFYSQLNGAEPTKQMTPLNWDQTHTLNASFYVMYEGWGMSFMSKLNTGQPYTPEAIAGTYTGRNIISGLTQNSRRKPLQFNLDLEIFKNLTLAGNEIMAYCKVFNVFDAKNPVTVFGDTGKPDYTLQQDQVFSYDKGWFTYPTYYSQPRSIYIGMSAQLDFSK